MDLQEKRKLDAERLAGRLAQVKARTRPWRSIIALVVALVAAAVNYEQGLSSLHVPGQDTARPHTLITAAVFCVFAAALAGTRGRGGPAPDRSPGPAGLAGLARLVAALEADQDVTGDAPAIADLNS